MPISCHFRDCKALLVVGLAHVSGTTTVIVQTFTFTFMGRIFIVYHHQVPTSASTPACTHSPVIVAHLTNWSMPLFTDIHKLAELLSLSPAWSTVAVDGNTTMSVTAALSLNAVVPRLFIFIHLCRDANFWKLKILMIARTTQVISAPYRAIGVSSATL